MFILVLLGMLVQSVQETRHMNLNNEDSYIFFSSISSMSSVRIEKLNT